MTSGQVDTLLIRYENIPRFPREPGEDSDDFLIHYDKIQDELDDEMVTRLRENLDGLLVFAGLIAGVNSAFLATTLTLLDPDPDDDITSLLSQLIQGLRSSTLPSITFSPSIKSLAINTLFAMSLALTFVASFSAILGKQWITIYRNRTQKTADKQRWEQLRRSLGAQRWGLVPVLETALPVIIQVALVIFYTGLVLFLGTKSPSLAGSLLVPLGATAVAYLLTVGMTVWDPSCPFRTPLSEFFLGLLRVVSTSAILRLFRFKLRFSRIWKRLREWMRSRRNQKVSEGGDGKVVAKGFSRRYDRDEEKGSIGTDVKRTIPVIDQFPSEKERRISGINTATLQRREATMRPKPDHWSSLQGLPFRKKTREEQVLLVESIMRVIRFSKESGALYLAALQLRSITDLELLETVCRDEDTTGGLRRRYLDAVEALGPNIHSFKVPEGLLRETLGLGTAFFHVALSADSFDEFIEIIGMNNVSLPVSFSEVTLPGARMAGEICRYADPFLRNYMNLQLRRLGAQPIALASTTLAANALWCAINGFPHSQDVLYGDRFRESLVYSEVSWAGLGLLASVSNLTCQFHDARKRKPYGLRELNWCRFAFLRVKETYYLSGPSQGLADDIYASFTSGKNFETNAILFKFAWRLFTREDGRDSTLVKLAERALSAGLHLICAIEKSIRFSKGGKKYSGAREICFKAMIENMGEGTGELRALRGVAWRQRLALATATGYMNYVMNLKGPANDEEDAYAKRFMEEIRKRQISSLRTTLAMGKEYADAKREFEETFLKLAPPEPDFIQQIQETQPTSLLARGKEYGSAKREFDSTFTKLGFHDVAGMVVSGDSGPSATNLVTSMSYVNMQGILSYWYQQREEVLSDVNELMSLPFGFEAVKSRVECRRMARMISEGNGGKRSARVSHLRE